MTEQSDRSAAEIVRRAILRGSSFYGELTTADAQRGVDALLAAGWTQPSCGSVSTTLPDADPPPTQANRDSG